MKYIIFAGTNGVGKSTLYHILPETADMPRVNVDEIARTIGDWRDLSVMLQAGKKALKLQKYCLNSGMTFNQETTLCGHNICKTIKAAKTKGYYIEVHFIGVDSPEICKERIRQRIAAGGHGIPDADIERRFYTSLTNMKKLLPFCDEVNFYDNTHILTFIGAWANGNFNHFRINDPPQWFEKYFLL